MRKTRRKIDNVMSFIRESILGNSPELEIKDPISGGIPIGSEARVFCFKDKKKKYKLVIWDVSKEYKSNIP